MTHSINFRGEKVVPVQAGQTVLQASLAAGIPHCHACGEKGQCTTCRVLVLEGQEQLTSPSSYEKAIKTVKKFPDNVRLACQLQVNGDGVEV